MRAPTIALVLGFLALSVPQASAQSFLSDRVGVRGGLVFSRFGGAGVEGAKVQIGLTAGVGLRFGLTRFLALEPELLYAEKGARFTAEGGSNSLKLGYLELPLLLKLRFPGTARTVVPHVQGGGSVALRVDCRQHIASGQTEVFQSCGNSEEPPPRRFDATLLIGAGVEIGRLTFDARFGLGLVRIDRGDPPADIKNRALYLLVGTNFRSPQ